MFVHLKFSSIAVQWLLATLQHEKKEKKASHFQTYISSTFKEEEEKRIVISYIRVAYIYIYGDFEYNG